MMKTIQLITLTATLALAACSKDNIPDTSADNGELKIIATIDGNSAADVIGSRAPQFDADGSGKGSFQKGDVWGMYTTIGGTTGKNTEYKYQETVLLWKDLSETDDVTFSAYYPRITADIDDPTAYVYTPVASDNTDDLLHATATASKSEAVALTFKHLMHRLVVNLTAGDGMTDTNLSSALINSMAKDGSATMRGSVEVNLLTGEVDYGYTGTKVSLSNGENGNADWKVAPQDLTPGEGWLRIAVGEDVWYYNVPADLNTIESGNQTRLESGKRLTLNLTLKKNRSAAASARTSTRAAATDDAALTLECTGIDVSVW